MSRKGGYHLLATDVINSDEDDEQVVFDSAMNASDGWSEGEENVNLFAEPSSKGQSNDVELVELRSRNSGSSKSLLDDARSPSPSKSASGRSRGSNNSGNNGVVLLERRVRKDDTLQKISLQFGISVAELKRVNGFLADTDLFARDIIKIPVQKYSYNHALIMAELDGTDSPPIIDVNQSAASASTSSSVPATIPITVNVPVQAEHLLQKVDANVQKAQRQLEQRQQSRDVFNADNGFDDQDMLDPTISHGGYRNNQLRSGVWLEHNVRHFLAVILVIFVLVGLPVVVYVLYKFGGQQDQVHGHVPPRNHSH